MIVDLIRTKLAYMRAFSITSYHSFVLTCRKMKLIKEALLSQHINKAFYV